MGNLCSGPAPPPEVELNSPAEDLIRGKHRTEAGRARAERRKAAKAKSYTVVPIDAYSDQRIETLEVEKLQLQGEKLVLEAQLHSLQEKLDKQSPLLHDMKFALDYIREYKEITERLTGRSEEIDTLTKSVLVEQPVKESS
jgi:hypothetical protein